MAIELVIFDAGGVLYPANSLAWDAMKREFGVTDAQMGDIWKSVYKKYSCGEVDEAVFLSAFEGLGIRDRSHLQRTLTTDLTTALVWIPGSQELVRRLIAGGYEVALLSDTSPTFAPIYRSKGFYDDFKETFLSYETGVMKPDPKAFKDVLALYKVNPANAVMIDDNPVNVTAAKALGMQGIVFESADSAVKQLADLGVTLS